MKTIDKINLFKVNNLSQMILCSEEPQQMPASRSLSQQPSTSTATKTLEDTENETNQSELSKQKSEKMYQYPHGILPPLKNVRKRRFRKTKKKKYMDAPEVEKEVKRLLR
jgi:TATA-binding protein-associated factor Taf7